MLLLKLFHVRRKLFIITSVQQKYLLWAISGTSTVISEFVEDIVTTSDIMISWWDKRLLRKWNNFKMSTVHCLQIKYLKHEWYGWFSCSYICTASYLLKKMHPIFDEGHRNGYMPWFPHNCASQDALFEQFSNYIFPHPCTTCIWGKCIKYLLHASNPPSQQRA